MTIANINFGVITRFYQQNERKIILLFVVCISIYLIAFVAKFTWSLMPAPELQSSSPQMSLAQSNGQSNDASADLSTLLSLNLFGDATAKPVEEVVQDVTDAPETKLNLLLSGVVSSADPSVGVAIIEYRNAQDNYAVGDKIMGTQVTLDEIYSDRVIIRNRVTRETLMLDGLDFEEANRLREQNKPISARNNTRNASSRSTATTSAASATENSRTGPRTVSGDKINELRQRLTNEPASFSDFVRLSPHRDENGFAGFKIAPGKEPEFFNDLGFQNGDVIIGLNGYDLTDPGQSGEALSLLKEADSLDIDLLRDGEFLNLNVEIPEV